ncbi:substrate-binding periplasmic protein [Litoribrevibacter albus]|uniref:substrate-binding periplasmic protein n=1 Tax=Litoribrevibacter albus TaxID=1473156 RepID=UPI0024E110BA|nr:transporter substrate-binding domain-containing protein [Litoribrevibacter albus]
MHTSYQRNWQRKLSQPLLLFFRTSIKSTLFSLILGALLVINAHASTDHLTQNAPVAVCDDENLWPPYAFIQDHTLTGAMIETTKAIFNLANIPYQIHLTPWKRCLYQVEHFQGDPTFEVFINGTYSEERASKFLVSQTVYSTGNAYFYSKDMFDAAPHIKTLSDLNDFSVCGVHGYNYDMYKIKARQLSVVANDLHSAFRLLKSGRCEVILNAYSVPYGSLFTDNPMIDDSIEAKIFEELPAQSFHVFVSKKTPRAGFLINQINQAITTMKNNGQIDAIFRKYLPDCGADC